MADETQDVKQEEVTSSESSTEQNETETNEAEVSEDVKPPEEVVSRDVYENVKKSMREERERRKEAERKLQENRTINEPPSDDAVYQDYLRTKADAFNAKQLAIDPTFKDRIEDVEFYLKQGHQIDMADKMAKADLAEKLLTEIAKDVPKAEQPKQLKTNAVPEEEKPKVSYSDIKSGKDQSPEAQKLRSILGTFN